MDNNCLIQRKVLRTAVTKTINELESSIEEDQTETDKEEVKSKSSNLDEVLEKELEQCENYRDNVTAAKLRFQEFSKSYGSVNKQAEVISSDRISINLPKLELTDFDGNPKNWFAFWAMFQKIDEDPKIEDDVKFAYLMQTTKDENSVSLNQCLATGPNYIELIPFVLNKFRKEKIGVISDIRKAFLQISVSSSDRDFLHFLWWEDFEKRKIKIYKHCRVVFGLTSSPFLLMATIYHHLDKMKETENDIAVKLKDAFYVDNVVTSVENKWELERFSKIACQIMSQAGFELTGWVSFSQGEKQNLDLKEYRYSPVLGLLWQPNLDTITCDISSVTTEEHNKCTKRQLLSISQKIFDPIGFTAPVTLIPKLLMQRAWKNDKLGWDHKLPSEIVEEFKNCDASGKDFAACVFLRIECEKEVQIKLVQAKSRVAPLKKNPITKNKTEMSIPKLELLAALIGTRLVQTVKTSLNISDIETFYWTDSKVVLC
nr:uncharacterized protein LOC122269777 [Parasteatoda tepidariorum]